MGNRARGHKGGRYASVQIKVYLSHACTILSSKQAGRALRKGLLQPQCRSLKSSSQCTAAAGKATKRHQGTIRKGPGKTDSTLGPLQRTRVKPERVPCMRADLVPCNVGRRALDTAMAFSKGGAIALHGKNKKSGTVWCGEEKAEWGYCGLTPQAAKHNTAVCSPHTLPNGIGERIRKNKKEKKKR